MKKSIAEGSKACAEVMSNSHIVQQGLLGIKRGNHAVSIVEGLGVTYTTKDQKNNEALISNYDNSYAYVQGFGNNEMIPKEAVLNKGLLSLMEKRGVIEAMYAHSHIFKLKKIVYNDKNMQFSKYLSGNELKRSKDLLSKVGGVDNVDRAFAYSNEMNKLLLSAKKMLYILSNLDRSSIGKEYLKNKETHDLLILLEKDGHLKEGDELFKIKVKIEEIIDGSI